MLRFVPSFRFVRVVLAGMAAVSLMAGGASVSAQFAAPQPGTQVHDTSILKPPAGARVAIVQFTDMECPLCGLAYPIIREAVAKYKIPYIHYDFPLSYHAWAQQAAVNARWFEANKGKDMSEEYRTQVYANQASFGNNPVLLNMFTQKFAKNHGFEMPFSVDPQGKFATGVKADRDLGVRIGIDHTPTIWVVTSGSKGAPYIEVQNINQLFQTIDQALVDTAAGRPAAKGGPVTAPAKK